MRGGGEREGREEEFKLLLSINAEGSVIRWEMGVVKG